MKCKLCKRRSLNRSLNILILGRKNIRRREDTERRIETERVATIVTTTAAVGEATAVANIPEEIHELDGRTILMEFNRQPARR